MSWQQILGHTQNVHRFFRERGMRHTELRVVEGMGHALPDPESLSQSITFLDSIHAKPRAQN